MEHAELTRKIDAYLEENWETMVEDIETLVRIPSFEESDKATEGAPFGPGPKEALEAALEMASDMGFKTHDAEGYIGFADFPGKSDTQLGIIGHMDVVPVVPGTEADWTHAPFSGHVDDTYIWGRGAIDMKDQVAGILEAVEYALAHGWEHKRTLLLAFGQDEETTQYGAGAIGRVLEERGVELCLLYTSPSPRDTR